MEEQIDKALALAQWEELKQTLEKECHAIKQVSPTALEFESDSPWKATVRNKRTGQVATLRFNSVVPCVHYAAPGRSGHFALRASSNGKTLQFTDDGMPKTVGELSMRIIQQIRNR